MIDMGKLLERLNFKQGRLAVGFHVSQAVHDFFLNGRWRVGTAGAIEVKGFRQRNKVYFVVMEAGGQVGQIC